MSDQEHPEKLEYHDIMWAELSPDIYDGPECDQVRRRWRAYAEGDMQEEPDIDTLDLAAKLFHPGTRVRVMEPMCPKCQEIASMCRDNEYCDFDWDYWTECEYS